VGGDTSAGEKAEGHSLTRYLLVLGAMLVGTFLLLDLVEWAFNRDGFFSIISVMRAATKGAPVLNVDYYWLDLPVRAILIIAVLLVCNAAKFEPKGRAGGLIVAPIILGGGFLVVLMIGEPITAQLLSAYGYARCAPGDHYIGTGRNTTWVDNYVRSSADCVAVDPYR
jgi:hypothetical protein